jgi:hypothetical protein
VTILHCRHFAVARSAKAALGGIGHTVHCWLRRRRRQASTGPLNRPGAGESRSARWLARTRPGSLEAQTAPTPSIAGSSIQSRAREAPSHNVLVIVRISYEHSDGTSPRAP